LFFQCAIAADTSAKDKSTTLDPDLERLMSEKRALEEHLAEKHDVPVPLIIWSFASATTVPVNFAWKARQGVETKVSAPHSHAALGDGKKA
jgi:hypothetical protein